MADVVHINYNANWSGGYTNFRDISNMPINEITAGSQNVKNPDGEKWEPRGGSSYFGVQGTDGFNTNAYWSPAHRIHSAQHTFVSKQGVTVPLRVFYSGTTAQGDVIEAWLPIYTAGGVATANKKWYQITATAPSTPIISTHRYYWAEWFDGALNVVQPELIFTFGDNTIGNWSGGFTPVVAVTGTTIQTIPGRAWTAQGFIGAPEGTNIIVVNGVEYVVTLGFGTDTVTVASTAGISPGDVAFQSTYFNDTLGGNTIYDVCSTINNQVYYEDWNQRNVYISWNRNQVQNLNTTIYSGPSGLDDATFTGTYTGTTTDKYQVSIDSTFPSPVTFTGSGADGLVFDTSGYTQNGTTNTYKVIVYQRPSTLNNTIVYFGLAGGNFVVGDVITGGTSGATGVVVYDNLLDKLVMTFTAGVFVPFEAIAGSISGATAVVQSFGRDAGNFLEYFYIGYKNGVNVASGPLQGPTGLALTGPFSFIDGITFDIPSDIIGNSYPTGGGPYRFYQGFLQSGDTWETTLTANVDTFSWTLNGVVQASHVLITGAAQLLSQGISVTFLNTTGHILGDTWFTTAFPTVIRGYSQFWYDTPDRFPGQGFTLLLDSNGYTMKPQENTMYLLSKVGHYYVVNIKLSANLLTESVTIERLKSEPQNRPLFPYLINYIQNQFTIITMDKLYAVLGRQKFLELPQMKSISDVVRTDFISSDWEDGDILYFKRKLYFSLPNENKFFSFDDYKKYWQAPDRWSKVIGLLAIIDDKLIGHSYERNESYELYTGDLNDLALPDAYNPAAPVFTGYPLQTKIVYAYQAFSDRFMEKASAWAGFEGYIKGTTQLKYHINFDIGGCSGQVDRVINPLLSKKGLCIPLDTASLGQGSLGHHGLGNDPVDVPNHFTFIDFYNNFTFLQRNIEVSCDQLDQRWSLVAVGTDVNTANMNNSDFINRVL